VQGDEAAHRVGEHGMDPLDPVRELRPGRGRDRLKAGQVRPGERSMKNSTVSICTGETLMRSQPARGTASMST
jgi:hypothetical protein